MQSRRFQPAGELVGLVQKIFCQGIDDRNMTGFGLGLQCGSRCRPAGVHAGEQVTERSLRQALGHNSDVRVNAEHRIGQQLAALGRLYIGKLQKIRLDESWRQHAQRPGPVDGFCKPRGVDHLLRHWPQALVSDRIARTKGLDGRTLLLFVLMLGEGVGLVWFGKAPSVGMAIAAMSLFGLCTHMACGATYALMPFIGRKALGGVAGLIGAGGNIGAVAAGFLNKAADTPQQTLLILSMVVAGTSLCAISVRFSSAHKSSEQKLLDEAIAQRTALDARQSPMGARPA